MIGRTAFAVRPIPAFCCIILFFIVLALCRIGGLPQPAQNTGRKTGLAPPPFALEFAFCVRTLCTAFHCFWVMSGSLVFCASTGALFDLQWKVFRFLTEVSLSDVLLTA